MAVKINSPFVSFFPHTYNEDWLFLLIYRLLGEGNIIWAGSIKQRAFNPYKYTSRATSEETGDILGESLAKLAMVICQSGRRFKTVRQVTAALREHANEDFWNMEINNRLDYLHNLREGLKSKKLHPRRRYQATRAIDHSIKRILGSSNRDGITGKELAEWTQGWCRDIELWNSAIIPDTPFETLADAFEALSFTNKFSYRIDNRQIAHSIQGRASSNSRPRMTENAYRYPGYTVKPRTPEVLEGLWLVKIVQDYLAGKELRMENIVTSADMLRFDRPTHWLTNVKPLFTVSMIVAYSESIAQVCSSVQDILIWTKKAGPSQLIVWIYGATGHETSTELDTYRNRITAQLTHDIKGTHIQLRSSILPSTGESINHVIDQSLNDISFAYWKQKIKAEHPIYVTNSRNELLRLGTFCQFMHEEQLVPRHSLKYYLKQQTLKHPVPQEISQVSDENALHVARAYLTNQPKKRSIFNQQLATKKMVYRMQKAQLSWVQLDDLAYDVSFHNSKGEESVEYIDDIRCIPISYHANGHNKHSAARKVAQILQHSPDKAKAHFIIIHGETDDSWEAIEQYHKNVMELVLEQSDPETLILSTTYRSSPGETNQLFRKRAEAIAEYLHWLQNHADRIKVRWDNRATTSQDEAPR